MTSCARSPPVRGRMVHINHDSTKGVEYQLPSKNARYRAIAQLLPEWHSFENKPPLQPSQNSSHAHTHSTAAGTLSSFCPRSRCTVLCCVVANTDSIVSDCVSTLDEKSDMSAEIAASFCSLSLREADEVFFFVRQNEAGERKSKTRENWQKRIRVRGKQESSGRTESIAIRSQMYAAFAGFLDCCRKSQKRKILKMTLRTTRMNSMRVMIDSTSDLMWKYSV